MHSHRYLHEAFRISCLLSLSTFVLRTPPSEFRVQLLVRQALSLLEQMHDQHLPGFCSSHWIIFVTALSCTPRETPTGEDDDIQRVEQLYDDFESVPPNRLAKTWRLTIQDRLGVQEYPKEPEDRSTSTRPERFRSTTYSLAGCGGRVQLAALAGLTCEVPDVRLCSTGGNKCIQGSWSIKGILPFYPLWVNSLAFGMSGTA